MAFQLSNAKVILVEEQQWWYLTHSWDNKTVHTFPRGIYSKVNVTAWLGFELAYFEAAVQHISHFDMRTLSHLVRKEDYGQFTLKALVPTRSPKFSSNELAQYFNRWPHETREEKKRKTKRRNKRKRRKKMKTKKKLGKRFRK